MRSDVVGRDTVCFSIRVRLDQKKQANAQKKAAGDRSNGVGRDTVISY
jgi:hypothetical protein